MCKGREPGTAQQSNSLGHSKTIPRAKMDFVEEVLQLSHPWLRWGTAVRLGGLYCPGSCLWGSRMLFRWPYAAWSISNKEWSAEQARGPHCCYSGDPTVVILGPGASSAAGSSLLSQGFSCPHGSVQQQPLHCGPGFTLHTQWLLRGCFPSLLRSPHTGHLCLLPSHVHFQVVWKLEKGAFQKQRSI